MCGIVGYIGENWADKILLDGLRRLEYRGYDSAGIATLSGDGKVNITKTKGKIADLAKKVKSDHTTLGIGHTRWATHGEPSEKNAHPHRAGDVILVHNGIIENFRELKNALAEYNFRSDTDSEVLAALIDSFYEDSLTTAVQEALKRVEGTYGIAVISPREPGKIVVARKGSPLVIGMGEHGNLAASDASALIGYAENVIYLNDGESAEITRDGVKIYDEEFHEISRESTKIATDVSAIQKNGYAHFLLKEIMEQPESLRATLQGRLGDGKINIDELQHLRGTPKTAKHVIIVGCGTAYYAGMAAAYYLEQMNENLTVEVVIASEFRYRHAHIRAGTIALVISQSGETADTLACLREISRQNVPTIGIVNTAGSTIARECDEVVYLRAGVEISVASTKAFTSQVAAILLIGAEMAQDRNPATKKIVSELAKLPEEIDKLLRNKRSEIKSLAKKYAKFDHALYLGRGAAYPVALEGALKLKETSYVDANAYAAGELKHGPIALIDRRFFEVFLLPDDELLPKSLSNLSEVNARDGRVLAITNSVEKFDATDILRVSTELKILTPLLLNVAQQLFAYYVAVARGNDVDQPRNLAKSVTVE